MRVFNTLLFIITTGVAAFAVAPVRNLYAQNRGDTVIPEDPITSLIRLVNGGVQTSDSDSIVPVKSTDEFGVLEYVSKIYEDNGYYSSGNWGEVRNDKSFPVIYTGKLPDYVSEQFNRPADGEITSAFGLRPHSERMHKGIDISLHPGDRVSVALDGIIERNGFDKGGYGHYIVVSHQGGLQTIYAHLQKSLLPEGSQVKAGDAIGLGGSTGNSTGPHLHFEIRYHGRLVDPTFMIGRESR